MSKSKRQHNFHVPEDVQHDPIPVPETRAEIVGEPAKTLHEVFASEDAPTADAVKTMVERADAHKIWFVCLNDEQRAFTEPASGKNASEPFCPVCGYRMVRIVH